MLHIYISVVMEDAIDILGSDKFLVSKDSNHYQKYWIIEDVSALVKEEYYNASTRRWGHVSEEEQ
jgi:hypothetical protein